MVPRPQHGLSLCAGGGGLDMGLGLAEPGFHTRCYVEWEAYPRQTLIAAQRAGYLAHAPIWDDVTTFDARHFAGAFDTLLAGYPCQPFSAAGQRKGADDERHLWPDVARIARELGPALRWIFLENVAGHVSLGLETVLRELREMGFTPAAGLFTAAETGAAHERERVFIVAYRAGVGTGEPDDAQRALPRGDARGGPGRGGLRLHGEMADADGGQRGDERQQCGGEQRLQPEGRPVGGEGSGGSVGHPSGIGRGKGRAEPILRGGRDAAACAGGAVGHPGPDADARGLDGGTDRGGPIGGESDCAERQRLRPGSRGAGGDMELADPGQPGLEGRERCGSSDERDRPPASGPASELRRPLLHAPSPADMDLWRFTLDLAPDLAPALSLGHVVGVADRAAQMVAQGLLAEEAAESLVRGMASSMADRSRALRLLGNGVHPLAAAYAWRALAAAHGLRPVDLAAASEAGGGEADGDVLK